MSEDLNPRDNASMKSHLEQADAVSRDLGQKIEVSIMDILTLTTLAELGKWVLFAHDPSIQKSKRKESEQILLECVQELQTSTHPDDPTQTSFSTMMYAGVAILHEQRLGQFSFFWTGEPPDASLVKPPSRTPKS